ncbi:MULTISPECIES: CBS domain-containing protein [unclassified Nocardia]|uniref:CBS domain-containing protein n=1 Tax=unclassified Nocardia TaxID=2637762 RepID=UPI0033AE6C53
MSGTVLTAAEVADLRSKSMPAKDFIELFGFRRRSNESVLAISEALRDAGLTTAPNFANCHRDKTITVVPADDVTYHDEDDEHDDFEPGTLPQRPFHVGDLQSARSGIHSVPPNATLSHAIHLMRQHNYSQIPVIDGHSDLRGVVTWQSVAAMHEKSGRSGKLTDAMIATAECAETHHELFPRLALIHKHGFMLVREPNGRFCGIVTPADITDRFHQIALPFFLVGEIEGKLRTLLQPIPQDGIDLIRYPYQMSDPVTIHDMSFGQYVKLLEKQDVEPVKKHAKEVSVSADNNWRTLGWTTVDRKLFVLQLKHVTEIRNRIAHFSPKPLPDRDIDELHSFCGLLNDLI